MENMKRVSAERIRAFTLIELLVVISIIALLMSVMMPALGKAREQAKKTVCLTNCKQWSTAVVAYTTENDDKFPSRKMDRNSNRWQGWPSEYYNAVNSSNDPHFDLMNSFLKDYIDDQKDFVCPSVKHTAKDPSMFGWEDQIDNWDRVRGDYSFFIGYDIDDSYTALAWGAPTAVPPTNERYDDPYKVPSRMSKAKSGMAVVGDAVLYLGGRGVWRYLSHPYKSDPTPDTFNPTGMCSGFVDGSSAWVGKDEYIPFVQSSSDGSTYFWPNPKR